MDQCWMIGHYPKTAQTASIPIVPGLVLVEWGCHVFRKIRVLAVLNWAQGSTVSVQHPSTLSHPCFPNSFYIFHASSILLCFLPDQTTLPSLMFMPHPWSTVCLGYRVFKSDFLKCKIIKASEQFSKLYSLCCVLYSPIWLIRVGKCKYVRWN